MNGYDSVVLGDIAKPDDGNCDYALIARNNRAEPFAFRTDDVGNAWLYFGTDSGFEGTTALFYTNFQAEFTPLSNPASVPEPTTVTLLLGLGLGALVLRVRKLFG